MGEKKFDVSQLQGAELFADYAIRPDIAVVQKIVDRVNELMDFALCRLLDHGIALERMKSFRETMNNDTGILVDDQKACTVSSRWDEATAITVALTWHAPFEKLEAR